MNKVLPLLVIVISMSISSIQAQKPGNIASYKIGTVTVSTLSEGQQKGNSSILIDAPTEVLKEYAPDGTFSNAVNAFLIQVSGKTMLVDAGFGRNLFDNMKVLGKSASEIDIILLTHMHGDHIGGLLKDSKVAFPNAELYISQAEHDYWTSDEEMMKVAENRRGGFLLAHKVIEAYKNKLHLFEPSDIDAEAGNLVNNVKAYKAYGHTPGHTVFLVESGSSKLLIWGDLTHAMAVQMPYPGIAVTYDVNPKQAIESRLKILDYVAKNNIAIGGMHIAFPAMGSVKSNSKGGYEFVPIPF